jgi:hypothetical protein
VNRQRRKFVDNTPKKQGKFAALPPPPDLRSPKDKLPLLQLAPTSSNVFQSSGVNYFI